MTKPEQSRHPDDKEFYLCLGTIVGLLSREDVRIAVVRQVRNGDDGARTRAYIKYAIDVLRDLLPEEAP